LRRTLSGHSHIVSSVAFSPEGGLAASGSYDWTVRIWDVCSGPVRHILSGHTSTVNPLSFNPEGTLLASGSDDQTVRIWEVSTGQLRHILYGHTNWVRALAFSPDGTLLASSSDDETVKLWEVESGVCLDTFRAEGPYFGLNITGATGISEAQRAALKALGAVEHREAN
jgi:WD40 repeat protein